MTDVSLQCYSGSRGVDSLMGDISGDDHDFQEHRNAKAVQLPEQLSRQFVFFGRTDVFCHSPSLYHSHCERIMAGLSRGVSFSLFSQRNEI